MVLGAAIREVKELREFIAAQDKQIGMPEVSQFQAVGGGAWKSGAGAGTAGRSVSGESHSRGRESAGAKAGVCRIRPEY